jgi:hypothetical protein
MTGRSTARRLRALGLATLLTALVLPGLAMPVAAATPDLTLVTDSTYEVLPDEGRIAVTVEITARNRLRDSVARRFFFRTAHLAVLPGTSGFEISGGRGSPRVSVRKRAADHTLLRIDLGANLASGRTTTLSLRFDLRDPGGAPDRPVRISPSLVTFDAWAYATPDTPGSTVTVTLPEGYAAEIGRGPLEGPTPTGDGRQAWRSGKLDDPLAFVADLAADRPAEHVEASRTVELSEGGIEILLRPWPDDPAWRDRIGDLVARALPALEREIGLPWPIDGPLAVEEALVRGGTGFAGRFEPAEGRIEIAYAAPDGVVLHELAHAWFNGRLVADRWIAEAFAAYYAERAAEALGIVPASPELTDDLQGDAVPLNAWRPADEGAAPTDGYGYAAAVELARQVGERAGPESLTAVWSAAAAGIGAYQPGSDGVEPLQATLDWRSLLDLLEDRTDTSFDDLWRDWVARSGDVTALRERAAARTHYAQTLAAADGWSLPREVRDALRAWQFEAAETLLADADRVLAARSELEAAAGAAGLRLPDRVRRAFEGGASLQAAAAEAAAELAAIAAIEEARASRPPTDQPIDAIVVTAGLLGTDPAGRLAEAADALAAGDVERAFDAAATAEDLWTGATRVGRGRIVSAALLVLVLVLLGGLVLKRRRRTDLAAR